MLLEKSPELHHARSNTYGWDGNAVGDLLHDRSSGGQSGRLNVRTNVVVDHHRGNQVQADLKCLQHEQRLLEIFGGLHLRNQTEEGHVSTVREHNVGDGLEGSVQVVGDSGVDNTTRVLLHTH